MQKIAKRCCQSTLALLLAMPISAGVSAEPSGEAAVKAAFLFNFFKFIEWPEEARLENYTLCVSSNDTLGDSLSVLENKAIDNKPLQILREVSGEALKKCQLVFISSPEQTAYIIHILNTLPIVTVSDHPGFIDQGGMIGLTQDDHRLSFEINLKVANASGVHISAKLLKLAKKVYTAKQ